jgi:hypothetical protein
VEAFVSKPPGLRALLSNKYCEVVPHLAFDREQLADLAYLIDSRVDVNVQRSKEAAL